MPIVTVSQACAGRAANNNQTIAAFGAGQRGDNLTRTAIKQILAMQNRAEPTRAMML
jgi:hypothetical protein